jgi:hypothetical protein
VWGILSERSQPWRRQRMIGNITNLDDSFRVEISDAVRFRPVLSMRGERLGSNFFSRRNERRRGAMRRKAEGDGCASRPEGAKISCRCSEMERLGVVDGKERNREKL